ncbi:DnaB-like helicase C-terminal domain-containing protein [uncultured Vagococcus sp.]|uniref:replicative DNA helicase n=1 Tax=uncultured Vagococcus sp. TaxID=189676 RepID=UPI0028D55A76|nr:DnaB-like helicase C-terminal domain-containing protein [uncultured Vagococcus sp.]
MTNILAEKAVLGSILLEGKMLAVGSLEAKYFTDIRNKMIFQGMEKLESENKDIDVVMLNEAVPNKGGIFDYLIELATEVPTSQNIMNYVEILKKEYQERKILSACEAYLKNRDTDTLDSIVRLANESAKHSKSDNSIRASLTRIITSLEKDKEVGIPTFKSFDYMIGGLSPERLNIIAARPSVGKTALALNIMSEACKSDAAVEVFSLEMNQDELLERVISSEISANSMKWRDPNNLMNEGEKQAVVNSTGPIDTWDLKIHDTGVDMRLIRERAKAMLVEKPNKKKLIIIDYLQLLPKNDKKSTNDSVGEITRELKVLSGECKVSILLLSQLSRGVEQRQDKRPQLSDLRDSGNIEQDADSVTFLYRDDYYEQPEDGEENNIIELIIRKNRHGNRGTAELLFVKEYQKFLELSKRTGD